jgi:protein O-mannosyl-transferase
MLRRLIICFGLVATTLALFWPVRGHDFINLDDPDYVAQNPVVQAGLTAPGVHWAFGASHANNWHPLTWLSHMLDCQLFGLKPGAHHLVGVGFHIASTILLFLALSRMTGAVERSALVAALFAWHPLHVESVAWIAERKDVLSGFFFMLTLLAYGYYTRKSVVSGEWSAANSATPTSDDDPPTTDHGPRTTHHAPRFTFHVSFPYVLCLLFFALGLMSKPMLVTVPFVLLLIDYWPLKRMRNAECGMRNAEQGTSHPFTIHHSSFILLEKLPFVALALAVGLLTLREQHAGGAITSLEQIPLAGRLANAATAYCVYLAKTFCPVHLSVFYPYVPVPAWEAVIAVLLLGGVSTFCVAQARRRPYLLVGWTWFCVMLLPVIGVVQVGWQAFADRYTYLPLIGVFIMVVWGAAEVAEQSSWWQLGFEAGAAAIIVACITASGFQLIHWRNSGTLFDHALKVTKDNWLAHNNLGTALAEKGKLDDAGENFRAALRIKPNYDDARNNLARFLGIQGNWAEAQQSLEELVRRSPRDARGHRNLGHVLLTKGNVADGIAQYALARQLQPDDPATAEDLAVTLTRPEQSTNLLPYLPDALSLLASADLRAKLADSWVAQGKFQCAVQAYRAALALEPDSPDRLNDFAWLLATCPDAKVRDGAEAVRLAERACKLTEFKWTMMVGTLAAAYAEAGRFPEAVATAQKACALATAEGEQALVERNQELLQFYREHRPFHGAAPLEQPRSQH